MEKGEDMIMMLINYGSKTKHGVVTLRIMMGLQDFNDFWLEFLKFYGFWEESENREDEKTFELREQSKHEEIPNCSGKSTRFWTFSIQ